MHHAAHGQTAAETKLARADAAKPMMGLTSWPGEKQGRLPTKQAAQIAKNYLQDEEMETLNRITVAFLEFAEAMAKNRKPKIGRAHVCTPVTNAHLVYRLL